MVRKLDLFDPDSIEDQAALKEIQDKKAEYLENVKALRSYRYNKALLGLKRAQTRVKRAATLLKKYQRQVRYYETIKGKGGF